MTELTRQTDTREKRSIQTWSPLVAVCVFNYLWIQGQVMMPHAASVVIDDLNTTLGLLQAAIAIVSLTAATLYMTTSKLGDRYGMKLLFQIGAVLYGVGALSAVLAPHIAVLIVGWSILRGIGTALMYPTGLALLVSHYEGKQRDVAFAVLAAIAPLGVLIGPLLMGASVTYANWRVPFVLETALIIFMLWLTRTMTETEVHKDGHLDGISVVLSILGVGGLILGPLLAGQEMANAFSLALAVTVFGLLMLLLLLWRVSWLQERRRQPLFRLSLFRNRHFVTGWLILGLTFVVSGSITFVLPIFVQFTLAFEALQSAYALTAFSVGVIVGGTISAWLVQRMAVRRLMQLAMVVIGFGIGWLYLSLEPAATVTTLVLPLSLIGLGIGFVLAQALNFSLSAVAPDEQGEASGLSATGQEIFYGLGVAVFGSILIAFALTFQAIRVSLAILLVVILVGLTVASFIPKES